MIVYERNKNSVIKRNHKTGESKKIFVVTNELNAQTDEIEDLIEKNDKMREKCFKYDSIIKFIKNLDREKGKCANDQTNFN